MKNFAIVIPAHNEEEIIENTISRTISFLKTQKLNVNWKVIIAENGSTDKTIQILKNIPKTKNFSFLFLKALYLKPYLGKTLDFYP